MRVMVIYDSVFGNTEQIARAIGTALSSQEDVEILQVSQVKPEQLAGLELLIVGSPTRAFRPMPTISKFLGTIPMNGLKGVKAAAFDTRIALSDMEPSFIRIFAKIFGYAAKPISDKLKRKGGELAIPPEGFAVQGAEGPLNEGELERAADWARRIIATP